ncbi:hypothetical protein V5H98_17615 [Georgenia sp. M64]|uniref:variant leucine-rich repeat-containing protein n=1 Tax=Georgenia sp. M64 TaxID=3120520 RepID=UPI0030DE6844
MVDDDALARQAADPGTPLATLQDLAAHHPRLRPTIAANPSTYPDLLEWLGRLGDPDVDEALAARGGPATAEYPAVPAAAPATVEQPAMDELAQEEQPAQDGPPAQEEPYTEVLPAPRAPTAPPPVIPPATVAPRPGSPRRTSVMGRTPGPGHPPAAAPTRAAPAAGTSTTTSVSTPAGAAALGADRGPAREARGRPAWALVALAVVLALALVWALTQRSPDPGPTSAPTAGAPSGPTAPDTAAPDTAEPTTAAPDDGAQELQAAREALTSLPAASACTDPGADAGVFDAFAAAAAPDGAWTDPADGDAVLAALTGLQDACGAPHAVAVSDALADGSPAIVATLAAAPDWVTVARPAPPGAQQRASFVSPSGNIACSLGEGSATCTINDRTFADPATCGPGPVTLVVGLGGDARSDCAAAPAAGNGTLEYGQSATSGRFACTSEESGVTCWSTLSGRGFTVARAAIQTF